jgi:hypothetical protein
MLAWDAAWFVDLAGVVRGAAEVGAVAPTIAILAFEERFAVFHVVVVAVAPGAVSPLRLSTKLRLLRRRCPLGVESIVKGSSH